MGAVDADPRGPQRTCDARVTAPANAPERRFAQLQFALRCLSGMTRRRGLMVGVLAAWALLLAFAGGSKLLRPRPAAQALKAARIPGGAVLSATPIVRLAGLLEIAVAGLVIGWGGPISAALLSATYLFLSVIAWRMVRVSPGQDCGCFGRSSEPITRWHLAVNLVGVAVGASGVLWPQPSVITEMRSQGLPGAILLAALTILLAWLCYLTMTALPALLEFRAKVATSR